MIVDTKSKQISFANRSTYQYLTQLNLESSFSGNVHKNPELEESFIKNELNKIIDSTLA